MERSVEIFDSTLRDGAQGEGISFSVEDKLAIVQKLDELGVTFIEAGNPGSNPRTWSFPAGQLKPSGSYPSLCLWLHPPQGDQGGG